MLMKADKLVRAKPAMIIVAMVNRIFSFPFFLYFSMTWSSLLMFYILSDAVAPAV
jgi:hypothetical protein